jgi:CheY-like chemotaxis protein
MKRINLPRAQAPTPPTDHQKTPARQLVLYVEDNADNREVASARLKSTYEVLLAADDKEACEVLVRYGAKLSLILMDIELKGSQLSGIDLARLVRGKLEPHRRQPYTAAVPVLDVPVIFVTAYGKTYPRADLLLAGGGEVIDKPINFVQLHTAMTRQYLGSRK